MKKGNYQFDKLIITAASEEYASSLKALLGSINLNWPDHPAVIVYDIGLKDHTRSILIDNDIPIKKVPPFCSHWRSHYTWKIWCMNDAPSRMFLWIDAGILILQPLNEIFKILDYQGYFAATNYELLDWEASILACRGCGVTNEFKNGKSTLAAGLMGFKRYGTIQNILEESLRIALIEKNIERQKITNRHDQAILSLLMYKYIQNVNIADSLIYLGEISPNQIPGQKIWTHRRSILEKDVEYLTNHISKKGPFFKPNPPYSISESFSKKYLYQVFHSFGKRNLEEASTFLKLSFGLHSDFFYDIPFFSSWALSRNHELEEFNIFGFLPWLSNELSKILKKNDLKKFLSIIYLEESFRYYKLGLLQKVRFYGLLSIKSYPKTGLLNRGLIIILLETFFGENLIEFLKKIKRIIYSS